jgi:hypothetical protein
LSNFPTNEKPLTFQQDNNDVFFGNKNLKDGK